MALEYREENPEQTNDIPTQAVQAVAPVVPYYSYILIGCLVVVWLVQFMFYPEHSVLQTSRNAILAGEFDKGLFLSGEYWRILTAATLHGGIAHLGFNAYALFALGRLIEFLSNRAHLPIVFLLSVTGGGIMSLIFLPEIPSIGASGGVIGFLGYLTAYGIKRRKLMPDSFLKNMLFNIVFIGFIGVFVIPNVDNFGHLGGLIVGLVYGFIQIPRDLYKDPRETSVLIKKVGFGALVIFLITTIFSIILVSATSSS